MGVEIGLQSASHNFSISTMYVLGDIDGVMDSLGEFQVQVTDVEDQDFLSLKCGLQLFMVLSIFSGALDARVMSAMKTVIMTSTNCFGVRHTNILSRLQSSVTANCVRVVWSFLVHCLQISSKTIESDLGARCAYLVGQPFYSRHNLCLAPVQCSSSISPLPVLAL